MKEIIYMSESVFIDSKNGKPSVGLGLFTYRKENSLPSYYTDFQKDCIYLRPNPKFSQASHFMNLSYQDLNKIELSLCSRLNGASPLPLPNFYYLIDLILHTNTLEIHIEIHADAFILELYEFLKNKSVILADPFKLMSLSNNPNKFNAAFIDFCNHHFDDLAAVYHLDHPRKTNSYLNS